MTSIPSLEESYRFCSDLAFSHYENFPVASLFIPRNKRSHVAAIYAFARIADDFADEPGFEPGQRLKELNEWKKRLEECYAGNASHPVFVALGDTVRKFSIPQQLFQRLLNAFVSDVSTTRYETFSDVLAYCDNSANPIGRLVLLLFGYRDERLALLSDHMCTALQLTNFWQDLSVDIKKDRSYLPLEDLRRFNVAFEDLKGHSSPQSLRNLLKLQVDRTTEYFDRGRPLLGEVGRDLRLQLRTTWWGGMTILQKIKQQDYDTLHQRPVLSFLDKAGVLFRALFAPHQKIQ